MKLRFQFLFPMDGFPIKFPRTQDPLIIIRNHIYISKFLGFCIKSRNDFRFSVHWDQKQPPEVFCKKGVLTNFAKFTGKHLCQSPFFNKVACPGPATLLKKRL